MKGGTFLLTFDGTYKMQRKGDPGEALPERQVCTWRVRIIDFSISLPDVAHIKPYAVVVNREDAGFFSATCAESLGKRICRDFQIDVKDLLWLEVFSAAPDKMYAAVFSPKQYVGAEILYDIKWRPVMKNEMESILRFI